MGRHPSKDKNTVQSFSRWRRVAWQRQRNECSAVGSDCRLFKGQSEVAGHVKVDPARPHWHSPAQAYKPVPSSSSPALCPTRPTRLTQNHMRGQHSHTQYARVLTFGIVFVQTSPVALKTMTQCSDTYLKMRKKNAQSGYCYGHTEHHTFYSFKLLIYTLQRRSMWFA